MNEDRDWVWTADVIHKLQTWDDLRDALSDLLDGLDANYDERCGLTNKEWEIRIKFARHILGHTNE